MKNEAALDTLLLLRHQMLPKETEAETMWLGTPHLHLLLHQALNTESEAQKGPPGGTHKSLALMQ